MFATHITFPGSTAEGESACLDWARTIVADTRAMRQEVRTLKQGLSGHLKIAAIPTALAMVSAPTTPYRARAPQCEVHHPVADVGRSPVDAGEPEVDAGSPISTTSRSAAMRAVPLYLEQYRLLTSADSPLGERDQVTWAEVGRSRSAC